jgi:hypothetical protein
MHIFRYQSKRREEPLSFDRKRINVKIDSEYGAEGPTKTICLSYRRANCREMFPADYLEERIEIDLEHETIHLVLDWLFEDKKYGNMVSWLFDYLDYRPRCIIETHEIPERKIKLGELEGIQSEHRKQRKQYLKEYFGKVVK